MPWSGLLGTGASPPLSHLAPSGEGPGALGRGWPGGPCNSPAVSTSHSGSRTPWTSSALTVTSFCFLLFIEAVKGFALLIWLLFWSAPLQVTKWKER